MSLLLFSREALTLYVELAWLTVLSIDTHAFQMEKMPCRRGWCVLIEA